MRPYPLALSTAYAIVCSLLGACSSSPPLTPTVADGSRAEARVDAGVDSRPDAPVACGTGEGALPGDTVEVRWDSGKALSNVRAQTFQISEGGKTYLLAKEPLHEAVRFDLEHPAKIVGFSIRWANVPVGADPQSKLKAGLYPDFGHNGFDYWEKDPYWEGTRCVKDHKDGEWLTYVLPKPVELKQPGLVYVAHLGEGATSPAFAFDDQSDPKKDCSKFADCHSALNLPQVPGYYNGLTFPFQQNFLVRLHVVYTDKLKPEDRIFQKESGLVSASHVSFSDYDGDGWDDALLDGKLYRNEQGKLTDVTAQAGLGATPATGGVFGDYNNDGCLDLFLFNESTTAPDVLLKSDCSGKFTDVTAAAGIVDQQSYNNCGGDPKNVRSPTAAAAWIDFDSDGYLDLYLANFICWGAESFYVDTVFHNKGDGTFEEWSRQHGFIDKPLAGRCAAPADYDGDGDVDLFVCDYRLQPNLLFVNNGGGTVTELGEELGAAGVRYKLGNVSYYGHTIGAAWGDLDNDGDLDLVAANLAHPRFYHFSDKTQILINQAGKLSELAPPKWGTITSPTGMQYHETHSVPLLADVNQDGNLDLAITEVYDGRPTDFYWGNGDGTFTQDIYHSGITTTNGWGIAASDFDHDGDLDVFATGLFRNTLAVPKKGHWLQVRVSGQGISNWAAIGATVRVIAGAKSYLRQVSGGSGKGGQDSLYLHFGLGNATSVDEIRVTFPGKKTLTYAGPINADQRVWLHADGTHHTGWGP